MKGCFEVVSICPVTRGDAQRSHGDCRSYVSAANLARIVRRTFPGRTVLVLVPKPQAGKN